MTNLPATQPTTHLHAMATEPDKRLRALAVQAGMELVSDPRFPAPVPAFMLDLPYLGDDEEVQARIAAQLFMADDPDSQAQDSRTIAARDFTGKSIVVHDIRTNGSNMESRWGAYLLVEADIVETGERQVFNTGAPQAVVRLAIAWARGELPLPGAFAQVGLGSKGHNPVITFIAEQDL
jgi:hypothetical protein